MSTSLYTQIIIRSQGTNMLLFFKICAYNCFKKLEKLFLKCFKNAGKFFIILKLFKIYKNFM